VKECISKALQECKYKILVIKNNLREKSIIGQEVTPFLLRRVNELSGGDSSKSSNTEKII
jgi:pseudouridine-5'-phosphate glycosidase